MESKSSLRRIAWSLVYVVLAFGGLRLATGEESQASGPQQRERMVVRKPWRVEPVKISTVKNKKKPNIEIGRQFDDDDDWLDGFSVTVSNGSDKVVTAVTIEMIFPREPGDTRNSFLQELHFGPSPMGAEYIYRNPDKVIRPGETADLAIGPQTYSNIKDALQQLGYPITIGRVELRMREVGFEDGSVLLSGTLWIQDPNSPNDPKKKIRADKIKAPSSRHHATVSINSRKTFPRRPIAAQSDCFAPSCTP